MKLVYFTQIQSLCQSWSCNTVTQIMLWCTWLTSVFFLCVCVKMTISLQCMIKYNRLLTYHKYLCHFTGIEDSYLSWLFNQTLKGERIVTQGNRLHNYWGPRWGGKGDRYVHFSKKVNKPLGRNLMLIYRPEYVAHCSAGEGSALANCTQYWFWWLDDEPKGLWFCMSWVQVKEFKIKICLRSITCS